MFRALIRLDDRGRGKLSPEECHHLVRVRRGKPGDRFLGLDGRGNLYRCVLRREGRNWYGEIMEKVEEERESPLRLILGQALIKKDKFEWVIQKATELGVVEIVPLISKRTELRLDAMREERRMKRWQKVVLEATKQCGRTRIPVLSEPMELKQFLLEVRAELKLCLDERRGAELKAILGENREVSTCLVLVGPEGGWDPSDRDLMRRERIRPVHLGPRILRSETAPLAILALLQYELGDLSPGESAPL